MEFRYEICSNIGNREINEDYAVVTSQGEELLAIVADGLGGHDKGEVASKLVSDTIAEEFHFGTQEPGEELHRVMHVAQEILLEYQQQEQAVDAMKTTCVVLTLGPEHAFWGHVGDSRGYVFYKDKKWERTCDHSVTQMLALAGKIKEKGIRHHEDRNKLLRVFGSEWYKDMCEISDPIEKEKVKAYLLCTDGFWELITERQMQKCLKRSKTPAEWLKRMLAIVEKAGKKKNMDNYTAVAIYVENTKEQIQEETANA